MPSALPQAQRPRAACGQKRLDAHRAARLSSRPAESAPVAQLDRVSASEAEGRQFESGRAHHFFSIRPGSETASAKFLAGRAKLHRIFSFQRFEPGECADVTQSIQLSCACGQVNLEVKGAPIVNAECCCNSCRTAGAKLQALPLARPILESNGTTRFVLYRKDRVRFVKGAAFLEEFRLTPESKTRRVVATCCKTPVFLEFQNGHWLSLYGCLWFSDTLPALEVRTMTIDLPAGSVLLDDVPNAKRHTLSFVVKLLSAWIAMGFRSPKIAVNAELQV